MVDLVGADGQRLPGLISAETTTDGKDTGTRIVLMAVPDRHEYENRLRQARADAEHAHALSTQMRGRLELLGAANAALASSVDVEVALTRLARTLVRQVADWCIIYAIDDSHPEAPQTWAAAHTDHAKQTALDELADPPPRDTGRGHQPY